MQPPGERTDPPRAAPVIVVPAGVVILSGVLRRGGPMQPAGERIYPPHAKKQNRQTPVSPNQQRVSQHTSTPAVTPAKSTLPRMAPALHSPYRC